jgi:hypothetical protein
MHRRFKAPWTAERIPGGYVVKDAVCYASVNGPVACHHRGLLGADGSQDGPLR